MRVFDDKFFRIKISMFESFWLKSLYCGEKRNALPTRFFFQRVSFFGDQKKFYFAEKGLFLKEKYVDNEAIF